MDKTMVIGRLTADPVKRVTQSGKELADFTIASDRGSGEYKSTAFFRCTAWGNRGVPILQYLHKGDLVCIEGQVNATAYTTHDGNVRANLEITVDNCTFLLLRREEQKQEEDKHEDFTPVQEDLPF